MFLESDAEIFSKGGNEALHKLFAKLLVSHLAAFEDDADVDLVPVFEEFAGPFGFDVKVVLANRDVKLDFLVASRFGVLLLGPFGFLLLEAELPIVEDLANRGVASRGDAVEVEVVAHGQFVRGAGAHTAEVIAVRSDYHDFRVTDVFVDGVESFLGTTTVVLIEVWDGFFLLSVK